MQMVERRETSQRPTKRRLSEACNDFLRLLLHSSASAFLSCSTRTVYKSLT